MEIKPTTPDVHYSGQFQQAAERLNRSSPDAWAGISEAISYLLEHGREATKPDVVWTIRESAYRMNSGEVRWPDPEYQFLHPDSAWRGLFVTNPDCDWFLFTVLGNKVSHPDGTHAWYREAAVKSDTIARAAKVALGLTNFPEM